MESLVHFRSQVDFLAKSAQGVRPPSNQQSINECEYALGRIFPSAYKEFLLIHDGFYNYSGSMWLLGTQDYYSSELNELFLSYVRSFVHAQGFQNFPFMTSKDFGFLSIYKSIDGKINLSKIQSEYKSFSGTFEEGEDWIFWPNYTLIGLDIGNSILLVTDHTNIEVILEVRSEGVTGKYESFYEWVSAEYDYTLEDVDYK